MAGPALTSRHRNRELRRRVMIRARLRSGSQWGDARILNISSRGLMIQTAYPVPEGSTVQVQRGQHLILAQVVWSAAGRSGLRSEHWVPVEDILSMEQSTVLQLIASDGVLHDRRRRPRNKPSDARLRGRAIESLAIAVIAISLAIGIWSMAQTALVLPLARVSAVLEG